MYGLNDAYFLAYDNLVKKYNHIDTRISPPQWASGSTIPNQQLSVSV